jgi:hypothetical protein
MKTLNSILNDTSNMTEEEIKKDFEIEKARLVENYKLIIEKESIEYPEYETQSKIVIDLITENMVYNIALRIIVHNQFLQNELVLLLQYYTVAFSQRNALDAKKAADLIQDQQDQPFWKRWFL